MTLYEKFKTVIPESEMDTHESDLYVPVTKETTEILTEYYKQNNLSFQATKFKDNITGKYLYDVPFGYMAEYIQNKGC